MQRAGLARVLAGFRCSPVRCTRRTTTCCSRRSLATLAILRGAAAAALRWCSSAARKRWATGSGSGFDADTEMLELINSGRLSDSPVGEYLHTLK